MDDDLFSDADVISSYSRAQALEDGLLVDVTELAKEQGFVWPVAITHALFATIDPSENEKHQGQDFTGRLWDVLTMLRNAMRRSKDNIDTVNFDVLMRTSGAKKLLHLMAVAGPGDDEKPVITIGYPNDF